jgi:hypothetical protein
MSPVAKIASLFANDITRQIEEFIKVDQASADIIAAEIDEYVVTEAIKKHFLRVLERYQETPQKPHEVRHSSSSPLSIIARPHQAGPYVRSWRADSHGRV